ncbi:carbohydrate kinase family protein [Ketogulonicigenium vulgare]|uniref:carbohydrate kinase family protein n=1 Tax=Ketogulonicigenium vulgare TaxID=92945 RepID=UPI002359F9B1|nr:PfkB family carbohydrate kinase [Ketogulonicigenium vulgare]
MTSKNNGEGVLSLGRIYADLAFAELDAPPTPGREVYAQSFSLTPGGGAVITAAHLVAAGRPAHLLARLGTDPIAVAIASELTALDLDLTYVERAADAGPQLTVAIVTPEDRAFITRRSPRGMPSQAAAALHGAGLRHLHIAEYATLAENPALIVTAKMAGLTISLDPSWDESLIHGPALLAASSGVDVFFPNMDEATALTGKTAPAAALDILAQHFPVVALKCGSAGAMLAVGTTRFSVTAPKTVVVDTIGAGDSFNAGFLDAWLSGLAPEEVLRRAVQRGSQSVMAAGGTGCLSQMKSAS